jgi:ECF sigma factor
MVRNSALDAIADLMAAFRAEDNGTVGQLIELFHPGLKRLAAGHLKGERLQHSLQPTLLVNEVYRELIKIKALEPSDLDRNNEKAAFSKPVIRSVVEMKVFEGLTAEEIAPKPGCSVVTVYRYWKFDRHWLQTKRES